MTFPARLFLAAALASLSIPAAAAAGTCEWRTPAGDPFTGDVPSAVDHYTDIPAETRSRLKERMRRFAYDDIVAIRRDSIDGKHRYEPVLRDMHFGRQRLCGEVTRKTWRLEHEERALAYCEDGHCIAVPLICRNVSRIVRRPGSVAMAGPSGSPEPLTFEAPGAGPQPGAALPPDAGPTTRPLEAPPQDISRLPPAVDAPPSASPLPPLPPPAQTVEPPATVPVTPTLPPAPEPPAQVPPVVTAPPPPPVAEPPSFPALPPPVTPQLPPPLPAVPEPSTGLLWATGLVAGRAVARQAAAPLTAATSASSRSMRPTTPSPPRGRRGR